MPRVTKPLTATEVKNASIKEKAYDLYDGDGLQLHIKPNGSKTWRWRYHFHGRRRLATFGVYPSMSLKEARQKRADAERLLEKDIDYNKYKQESKRAHERDEKGQFHNVVQEWGQTLSCSPGYKAKRLRAIERDIFPFWCKYDTNHAHIVSSRHLEDISHADILRVIKEKARSAPETATRLLQDLRLVWRFAISQDLIDIDVTAKIDTNQLPKPSVKHYPKIVDEVVLGEMYRAIDNYNGYLVVRNMLRLLCHIPLRPTNMCTLRWEMIDFDAKLIVIPRHEMKVSDSNLPDFKMPMTENSKEILKETQELTGWGSWVFHGARNIHAHLNVESGNKALRSMGFGDKERGRKQTLHSFRGTFRSLAEQYRNQHGAHFEVLERALDHQEEDKSVRAYQNLTDYTELLRPLMQWWSDAVEKMKTGESLLQ